MSVGKKSALLMLVAVVLFGLLGAVVHCALAGFLGQEGERG